MPNARQYPFQVVEQRGAVVAPSYNRSAAQLADQLQALLQNGVNATAAALNANTDQTEIKNRQLEAQGRLSAVAEELGKKQEIVSVENDTQARNLEAGIANEHMQEARLSLQQLLEQRKQQGFGMINNADKATVVAMVNDGTAHNMDPLGYLQMEQQAGERLATLDTTEALKAMAKNPDLTPEQVVGTFMGQQPLNSELAKASYAKTLSSDLLRYYGGAQLDLIRQTRQQDTENLMIRLQRDISFDVRDESLSAEKLMQRITDYGTKYRAINRTASEADVYKATAEALTGVVGSGELARFAPGRLLPILDGVKTLADKDPVFLNLWGKVAGDIRQQVIARESNKVGILGHMIDSAQDQTGLESATAAVLTAGTGGEIFPTSAPGLREKIEKRKTELQGQINADNRVYQAPNAATSPLPHTEAQDKAIDRSVSDYIQQNPKLLPNGQKRNWTMPEVAVFTYQRTGRLTATQLQGLNSAVAVPLDMTKATPEQVQPWTDAVGTIQALVDTAPQYVRQLVQEGSLSPKLAVAGVAGASLGKVQSAGYGVTSMAHRLADIDEGKLLEADAILKGETQFTFPGSKDRQYINAPKADINAASDLVANPAQAVNQAFTGWWFSGKPNFYSLDYGSQTANDAFAAAFKFNYAKLRQGGMDVLPAAQMAKSQAGSDVAKAFESYDLGYDGGQRYVVTPDFPILAGLPQQAQREQAMKQYSALWVQAQSATFDALRKEGKVSIPFWTGLAGGYQHLSLDMDKWKVEGNGADAMLVVPIRLNGVDMLNLPDLGQEGVFKVPLDLTKRKGLLAPIMKNRGTSIGSVMDMPQWGISWGGESK